uniref:Uncharacterized protein n=1 Tax=Clastoptera arizonana TaxID=38151 RepID=A0A1B6DB53_9HEMI
MIGTYLILLLVLNFYFVNLENIDFKRESTEQNLSTVTKSNFNYSSPEERDLSEYYNELQKILSIDNKTSDKIKNKYSSIVPNLKKEIHDLIKDYKNLIKKFDSKSEVKTQNSINRLRKNIDELWEDFEDNSKR